ncbi:MAG: glutathione peroxidase [Bdellovibrionaceae bacterium]|nr:glutathione peroxidase [Pseudobdellovibrionaceae bacterium]
MLRFLMSLVTLFGSSSGSASEPVADKNGHPDQEQLITQVPHSFFDMVATGNDGQLRPLHEFRGQVLLVANTASKCGYTRQYDALQKMHAKYKDKGFSVLGFPSNDFGWQEPGSDKEIKEFCLVNFNIDFPLFQKNGVKGAKKQPVYKFLTTNGPSDTQGEVKWNFEKFLIARDGKVVARYRSSVKPDDPQVAAKIEELLKQTPPSTGPKEN